jgi:hypothetical protein
MAATSSKKVKITKRVVDATKPGERDAFIWDAETKGFGLKVTPCRKQGLSIPVPTARA